MTLRSPVLSCLYFFLISGIAYSQITSRMPALKAHAQTDEAGVGLALLCLGAGSLTGFVSVSLVFKFLSSKRLIVLASSGMLTCLTLIALCGDLTLLCICFYATGLFISYVDVSMNTQAVNLELSAGKPYLQRLHAGYNLGGVLGSALGALFAFFESSLLVNYGIAALLCLVPVFFVSGSLLDDSTVEPGRGKSAGSRSRLPFFIILCGLLCLLAFSIEGSVGEWGGLVLHDAKGASQGTAALVYGGYCAMTVSVRLAGDKLRTMLGDFKLLLLSALISLIGFSLVHVLNHPYAMLFAYCIVGLGMAAVVPLLISLAGSTPGVSSKTSSATVSFFGYSGLLVYPPALGFLASHWGLMNAMFVPVAAILLLIAGSFVARSEIQRRRAGRDVDPGSFS